MSEEYKKGYNEGFEIGYNRGTIVAYQTFCSNLNLLFDVFKNISIEMIKEGKHTTPKKEE